MDSASSTGAAGTAPVSASARAFRPGELLGRRYRVRSFLAAGGMGEVYEVEDLDLATSVALKTIRPDYSRSAATLRRFKREVLLARAVVSPSVCRIFDLGKHAGDGADGDEVYFLTMELLRGETLTARVRGHGGMRLEEALPLVEQMAQALEAAHRVGVVHRDFKSGNVMLAESGEGSERAVVTDFGLACSLSGGEGEEGQTVTCAITGTPAYMAPEQVRGERAGPPADIYAFGIVLVGSPGTELEFAL